MQMNFMLHYHDRLAGTHRCRTKLNSRCIFGMFSKYINRFSSSYLVSLLIVFFATCAHASGPEQWQLGFQEAGNNFMRKVTAFQNLIFIIMFLIVLFVTMITIYVLIRYNKKSNPVPSTTSHNTAIEIAWTLIPILIVIAISFPSIKLLSYSEKIPEADMTIKVAGYQWYWNYDYPDYEINYDSNIVYDISENQRRLLEVDNRLILPVGTVIRVLVSSGDVIHSFGVPSLGVKRDAIPGKINETWFEIDKEGVYYGQCYELCGAYHGFMPIVIEAISKDDFKKWVKSQ
ncbi:MAG: cytochrome c oxidase, subunit II [Candidatus Xenolissoclinum pacificiensis L6]|uniref:Cytochrome c oxidase subunit 2 n=1 Tax=Candidatus Xenolissoclinum pacificiensis L6 TaxID=1401685 RepID=W2UZS8_9RICK|nr:MAG: cytochrome c oxidase, subunit II [Candidatus Xenolissoclinum pacificiensis L6]